MYALGECGMTRNQMRDLALKFGFKLKKQDNGEEDLNQYVYDLMEALLRMKNTNSRLLQQEQIIERLEKECDQLRTKNILLQDRIRIFNVAPEADYVFTEAELAEHDAEVIEKVLEKTGGRLKHDPRLKGDYHEGWNDLVTSIEDYANQLRQKAQEKG
jgi:hypothetical protein